MTDHDMLIQLCEKVDLIYVLLSNHLEHHARYTLALLIALISTVTALGLQFWRNASKSQTKEKAGDKVGVSDDPNNSQPNRHTI